MEMFLFLESLLSKGNSSWHDAPSSEVESLADIVVRWNSKGSHSFMRLQFKRAL